MVKAGRYPMYVHDYKLREREEGVEVDGFIKSIYVNLPGKITTDEFGARFCGVPVGSYDIHKNAGKESNHYYTQYLYAVADAILRPDGLYKSDKRYFELLPEYEAKNITFVYTYLNGEEEQITTHGIFLKGDDE